MFNLINSVPFKRCVFKVPNLWDRGFPQNLKGWSWRRHPPKIGRSKGPCNNGGFDREDHEPKGFRNWVKRSPVQGLFAVQLREGINLWCCFFQISTLLLLTHQNWSISPLVCQVLWLFVCVCVIVCLMFCLSVDDLQMTIQKEATNN